MKKNKVKPKKLIVKRSGGYTQSVTNPNLKKGKIVVLVQRSDFTVWTPVSSKTFRRIKSIKRGRTELKAIKNALRTKGVKKVEFA